ncbi:MAG: bacillithiol biosynthesis deacetylase BshB1 [Flammeovirgaceae bacterium]|nr:bacillithiol biosynthesis deacetylase BshB1 [Flammeovirgaceae bacterium]
MKLDILVIASHPDDAELGCGGTMARHISLGHAVGIIDLTKGELGTRGTVETRKTEADEASKILGVNVRENLGLADGFFQNDEVHQRKVIETIRKYKPEIVLTNAITDRHPDHGKGARLVYDSCFLSGLRKIETKSEGKPQDPWRPKQVYHFIQSQYIQPDFVVDISDFWQKKVDAIKAFKTQFFDANSKEPETYISRPIFIEFIEARAKELGHSIGVQYGEGFTSGAALGVNSLFDLNQ